MASGTAISASPGNILEVQFFPVLLRSNELILLYKSKVYSMMVWLKYIMKWLPPYVHITSIFSCRKKKGKNKGKYFCPLDKNFGANSLLLLLFIYIYLAALGLSCGMWDLVLWPGIEPGPPALGMQSLSQWITREVP